jgi:hypothetical protein
MNSQILPLSTQGYPKAASSTPYYTSYTQPIFQLHLTPVTATFADDTTVVATDCDPATASQKLQASLLAI